MKYGNGMLKYKIIIVKQQTFSCEEILFSLCASKAQGFYEADIA